MGIIGQGPDGYYHPASEEELRALVAHAYERWLPLRVRGSGHSVAQAIYTTGFAGEGRPPEGSIDVMLDQYIAVTITPDPLDPSHAIAEVDAGCHLGRDPYDPTGTSTWKNSLNYQLQTAIPGRSYALSDLGGISHQTVSGFLATGSSGGSILYSVYDNITRLRLIDGAGAVHDVSRDDPDPRKRDLFFAAAGASMGLLGVVSKVWFRVGPSYNISGNQVTTGAADASIDFFGDQPAKLSLEDFLRRTPYTRLMWWPQHGFERMQVWQAARLEPMPGFKPKPYEELGRAPQLASLAGSLFYTLIGNLSDISAVPAKLDDWYKHLDGFIGGGPDQNACAPTPAVAHGRQIAVEEVLTWIRAQMSRAIRAQPQRVAKDAVFVKEARALLDAAAPHLETDAALAKDVHALLDATAPNLDKAVRPEVDLALPDVLARAITKLIELLINAALSTSVAQILAKWLASYMPYLIKDILDPFVAKGTQDFQDTWMCALPMDNQMDDQLWPTEFTELWIPVEQATAVMQALRDFYRASGDAVVAYQHTGAFSCELYAAKASPFWMSPSYGIDVFRVDVFWFGLNAGSPSDRFYPMFWELLARFDFRPHWGKVLPPASDRWRAYYRRSFPMLERFLELRRAMDPRQIFVSQYWRDNLGIEA